MTNWNHVTNLKYHGKESRDYDNRDMEAVSNDLQERVRVLRTAYLEREKQVRNLLEAINGTTVELSQAEVDKAIAKLKTLFGVNPYQEKP